MNHRSPGYEPDGISKLPHLAIRSAGVPHFESTVLLYTSRMGDLMREEVQHQGMRTNSALAVVMFALVLTPCFAGCLGEGDKGEKSNPIQMNIYFDTTSGTIVERIQNGALISQSGVELSFDFARVTSKAGAMKTFTLNPGDDEAGANSITVNANEQAELSYTYQTHGMFTVTLIARDERQNMASLEVKVRIEKEIDWTQSNTNQPSTMVIATTPDCVCATPEKIQLQSTISNPNELVPGTQVTISWHLHDPDEQEQAKHTEQIADGQDASWTHNQYYLSQGDWTLDVTLDAGNDSINIHHLMKIVYVPDESKPNPLNVDAVEGNTSSLSVQKNEN